ncbi:hypothetical protein Tco_0380899 [Tanacetum coccineum]
MRDRRKDTHASQIYMKDDTPMREPHEANYVQGYHDRNSKILYSNQNRNPNCHYPYLRNRMPHPSKSFELPKTSMEEMMREWMTRQMETNERMKNHVVELERKIKQGIKKPSSYFSLKDYTVHIPYTNAKTFSDDVLLNHVGGEELKSIDGVGTGRMKKKEKSDNCVPKEPNKEWKMNEKVVPHKENIYHY